MKNSFRIGIDIGGTKTTIGLMDADIRVVDSVSIPTGKLTEPGILVRRIGSAISEMLNANELSMDGISFIGAGVAGSADTLTGVAVYCPNLGWREVPLGDLFLNALGREVLITQDSWAAAWAEHRFGAGRGYSDMACITLGTGIGCGVIQDGHILHGAMNTAGEVGHMSINPEGRMCSCGQKGCLEQYASGTAIYQLAMERFPKKLEMMAPKAESVFELAYKGDEEALGLIAYCMDRLAFGLANLINILSVDVLVFSGGMSVHKELILDPLPELMYRYGYPSWTNKKKLLLLQAELGTHAPMIGAAFFDQADKR